MAKGKKTGGRNFKPGNRANPKGRPRIPADLKKARQINGQEFARTCNRFLFQTLQELERDLKGGRLNVLEHLIAFLLKKACSEGDPSRVAFIFDRVLGRPPSAPADFSFFEEEKDLEMEALSDEQLRRLARDERDQSKNSTPSV